MGYTITIGEAVLEDMTYDDDPGLKVSARGEALDEAPEFENDGMTGNTNSRSPSYTAWSDFCRETGLYNLFFGGGWSREDRGYLPCENLHRESPLMAEHPGFRAINKIDADIVSASLAAYRAAHPNATPGFDTWAGTPGFPMENATLARLIWLEFWMRWAVENCTHPIIENT